MIFDCPSLSTSPQVWQWRDWHKVTSSEQMHWGMGDLGSPFLIWGPHYWPPLWVSLLWLSVPAIATCANGFSICGGDPRGPLSLGHILQVAFWQQLQGFLDLSIFYSEALGPTPHVCWSVDKDSLIAYGLGLETLFVSFKSDKICDLDIKLENFWWYYWVVKRAPLLSHDGA